MNRDTTSHTPAAVHSPSVPRNWWRVLYFAGNAVWKALAGAFLLGAPSWFGWAAWKLWTIGPSQMSAAVMGGVALGGVVTFIEFSFAAMLLEEWWKTVKRKAGVK